MATDEANAYSSWEELLEDDLLGDILDLGDTFPRPAEEVSTDQVLPFWNELIEDAIDCGDIFPNPAEVKEEAANTATAQTNSWSGLVEDAIHCGDTFPSIAEVKEEAVNTATAQTK